MGAYATLGVLFPSQTTVAFDAQSIGESLLAWYRANARRLPWRETTDPYAIWVSEIMLQQTRVEAVVPYYARFMARFPTIAALAEAEEVDLLAAWSGLGYYSRARNLQKSARIVTERGGFPRDYAEIVSLPGIGDYTAAAIASIAFGMPHAVLDGNVVRVVSRLTADFGDIAAQATKKRLRDVAQRCLPEAAPGDYNQAVMELGATICAPRDPKCLLCPVSGDCKARLEGVQNELPTKLRRQPTIPVEVTLLQIEDGERLLFWQRPEGDRMAGFWELPDAEMLAQAELGEETHHFRHSIMNRAYRCTVWSARLAETPPAFTWLPRETLAGLPLSTMSRKALRLK